MLVFIWLVQSRGLLDDLDLLNRGHRFTRVWESCNGFDYSGQYFLTVGSYYENNTIRRYYPIEYMGDDLGIYLLYPWMQKNLRLNYKLAYFLFSVGLVLTSYINTLLGFHLLFNDAKKRIRLITCIVTSLFCIFCLYILDVYIWSYFLTSFIPLVTWAVKKRINYNRFLHLASVLFIMGLLIGIGNQFRRSAGTGLALFILILLLSMEKKKVSYLEKAILITLLLLPITFSDVYFGYQLQRRDVWLTENNQIINHSNLIRNHVLWHSMYMGLSFVENPYGIIYSDSAGIGKARQIQPGVWAYTTDSEDILRREYLSIIRANPFFILKTYIQKTMYSLLFIFIAFNIGSIFLMELKPPVISQIPFIVALAIYTLPGIMGWPNPAFILGAINVASLWSIILFNEWATKNHFV